MAVTSYKASAPGNVMVLGEYAVTQGHPALVWAINKHINITLLPRNDRVVRIQSDLGAYQTSLEMLTSKAPFEFVLAAIQQLQPQLTTGFDLQITSTIEAGIGLSSSAAVTVATLKVVYAYLDLAISNDTLLETAIAVVRAVQGKGSGADVAASIYGGLIYYQAGKLVKTFDTIPPFFILYSGIKNKTDEALQQFNPTTSDVILNAMAQLVIQAAQAIDDHDWHTLGALLAKGNHCLQCLNVNTPLLDDLVTTCEQQATVFGAKISGSGFGDCVIGLGTLPHDLYPSDQDSPRQIALQEVLTS
ncbi:MAG: mevalonate kinase [Coxiella sp. (in: Bacteria)]|nr:MAG: mevalonate kinase [Coxiella sp. (in: g-proteobacteria)]